MPINQGEFDKLVNKLEEDVKSSRNSIATDRGKLSNRVKQISVANAFAAPRLAEEISQAATNIGMHQTYLYGVNDTLALIAREYHLKLKKPFY